MFCAFLLAQYFFILSDLAFLSSSEIRIVRLVLTATWNLTSLFLVIFLAVLSVSIFSVISSSFRSLSVSLNQFGLVFFLVEVVKDFLGQSIWVHSKDVPIKINSSFPHCV